MSSPQKLFPVLVLSSSLPFAFNTAVASTSPYLGYVPYIGQSASDTQEVGDDLVYLARKGDLTSQMRLRELFPKTHNTDLQRQAVAILANFHGLKSSDTLVSLYGSVEDAGVKSLIVSELFSLGDRKNMEVLANAEKNPKLHQLILSRLSVMAEP